MKIIYLAIFALIYGSAFTYGKQVDSLSQILPETILSDTVCYKLQFRTGDTLTYRIVSFDSIAIDYGTPLLKTRYERIKITCDSIKNGKFFLSHELINYLAYESSGDIQKIERTESPWIGKKVWYAIDSSGQRYALGYDDTTHAILAPGNAFQPHLIFPIGKSCHKVNETWMTESLDELVENGFPLSLVKQSSLFRAMEPIDTLEEHCLRFNYIKTAQGSYKLKTKEDTLRVTNIITGYGILDISSTKFIPVHYLVTTEQKLTLLVGNKEPKPGWHYILSYFTLESFKEGKKVNTIPKKNKK